MIIATNANVCRNLVLLAPGSGSLRQCGKPAIQWFADGVSAPAPQRCAEHTAGQGGVALSQVLNDGGVLVGPLYYTQA